MINLFHIPDYTVKTKSYDCLVRGNKVNSFEQAVCEYVCAPYAVGVSSATAGTFLALKIINQYYPSQKLSIPSIIPQVVPNNLVNCNVDFDFNDNIDWIGHEYILLEYKNIILIDSAQAFDPKVFARYQEKYPDKDVVIIFSLYPTKPLGGIDGGLVVSNNKEIVEDIRCLSNNGFGKTKDVVDVIGWKMYMNNCQADVGLKRLKSYNKKRDKLDNIRQEYITQIFARTGLNVKHSSYHTFQLTMKTENDRCIEHLFDNNIASKLHYPRAHVNQVFKDQGRHLSTDADEMKLINHEMYSISIPFHERLSRENICNILDLLESKIYIG